MNLKGQKFYKTLMIIFITVIVTLLLSTVFIYNMVNDNIGTQYLINGKGNIENIGYSIKSIKKILDKYYFGDFPDEKKMVEGAVKGYVEALDDEYTEYMTSDEWKEYKENQLGNYTGIGVYLKAVDEGQQVVAVIKDSPAEKAQIEVEDILVKVDDIFCTKDNGTEVTDYIKKR